MPPTNIIPPCPKPTFLGLPVELRLRMYDYLVPKTCNIYIAGRPHTPTRPFCTNCDPQQDSYRNRIVQDQFSVRTTEVNVALAQVSKKIRGEFVPQIETVVELHCCTDGIEALSRGLMPAYVLEKIRGLHFHQCHDDPGSLKRSQGLISVCLQGTLEQLPGLRSLELYPAIMDTLPLDPNVTVSPDAVELQDAFVVSQMDHKLGMTYFYCGLDLASDLGKLSFKTGRTWKLYVRGNWRVESATTGICVVSAAT